MKILYKEEKRRIGAGRWGIMIVCSFFYFLNYQRMASNIKWEKSTILLSYQLWTACILGIIYILYLNWKLFFIKEQGKTIYLLKKYELIPVRKKILYQIRIYIILEMIVWYTVISYGIYRFTAISNFLDTEGIKIIWKIFILVGVLLTTLFIVIITLDICQEGEERN